MRLMNKFTFTFVFLVLINTISFSQEKVKNTITYEGAEYFINGLNVPWNHFGADFGNHVMWGSSYEGEWFENFFKDCENYGVNVVRLWIHCDGRANPEFDSKGNPIGLDTDFFLDLDDCFRRAQKHNVMIMPCMWSFDMCKDIEDAGPYAGKHQDLLNEDTKMNAYIKNVWEPIVKRYKDQCNLFAWEICNEPEWALDRKYAGDSSWTYRSDFVVPVERMQKLTGLMAATVHKYSKKLVTTGSASMHWNSEVSPSVGNIWNDESLQKATYNLEGAYLDFYQVHYYDYMAAIGGDLYDRPLSHWKVDKPVIIGETPADKEKAKIHTVPDVQKATFDLGYAGVMYWSYNAQDGIGVFDDFKNTLKDFAEKHPKEVYPQACPCNLLKEEKVQIIVQTIEKGKYIVDWKSEDPFILDHFEIEVSEDGVNYKTQSKVMKKNDTLKDYVLKFKSKEEIKWLRLKQVDVYEIITTSAPIKI